MRFSVNGSDQGVAFRVAKSELAGRALFPHVLTKNQVINCPFCWSYCPFCWSYCPIPTWNPRIFTNMLINYWVGVEKTKNNDPWKFQFYNLLRTSLWTLAKCLVPFARLSRATPLLANWTLPMELSGYLCLKKCKLYITIQYISPTSNSATTQIMKCHKQGSGATFL